MKLEYWALVAVLLVWLLIAWFLGVLLHLEGRDLWILRIGLAVIGIAAVAALWWWLSVRNKEQAGQSVAAGESVTGGIEEVGQTLRVANSRLASAAATKGKKLASLPAILLVGDSGSGKTSLMGGSGLDADLIAGQVLQGNALIPTRLANVWFARGTVLIEAGGGLLANPGAWAKLVRGLVPPKMRSLFGKPQPPRAVVVAVDLESFTQPGASDAVGSTLRNLQARLREVSQLLGISFPVYVIFGKADRLPFFGEYVNGLTNEEITQVVGTTLPIEDPTAGVYGEQQARRLTAAFDELTYSLSDKRQEFLRRERNADSLPGIYEFPRELRKLRSAVVQFLVEACRPSQLRSGPLLRGFYFAGIRTVTESTFTPVTERPAAAAFDPNESIGATRVFNVRQAAARAEAGFASQAQATRQVPQWVFLSHIFPGVILQDRAALGASASSTQTSFLRRLLLGLATAVFLVCLIGFTISFFGNRALENQVLTAAQGIGAAEGTSAQLASLDGLQRLEKLRQSLDTLRQYEDDGPPLHLRWGLYVGESLYPAASRVYFNRFHQLLFAQTQNALLGTLRGLPPAPGPNDAYGPAYQALKAYLITTTNHEKSTREFLSPALLGAWIAGRDIDQDRRDLAQKQFDFYSAYLAGENPFSSEAETATVQHARDYLSKFAGAERVYQSMLTAANDKNKPVNYNRDFPGSASVIVNSHEVPGAFTKGGWAFMQDAILHPDRYFSGEEWVLGPQSAGQLNTANLTGTLKARYLGDDINQWRTFLRASTFVGYRNIADADHKLDLLSGNQSPLLELFWEVSQNTSVDADLAKAFQPPQAVVPASLQNQYVGPSNQNYLGALLNLKGAVDQLQTAPPGTPPTQVQSSALSARGSTDQVAQTFAPDRDGHVDDTVKKLMLAPILSVDSILPKPGAALNAGGAGLCTQFRQLVSKYPFNPGATTQASMQEFNSFFQPGTGTLWTFYEQNLKPMLPLQGTQYVAQPGIASLTPQFVSYFNRAAALSQAIYAGSPQPHLSYKLTSYTPEGLQGVTLIIDGQTLVSTAGKSASQQFLWPGPGAPSASLLYKIGGQDFTTVRYNDPWAIFHFFAGAQQVQEQGGVHTIHWVPETSGQPTILPNGKVLDMRFDLDMGGAPPIFLKSYWSSFGCVSKVAQ